MAVRPPARHARPRGRGALTSAYEQARRDLAAVSTARWHDQMEVVRLTALTEQLATRVSGLQAEIADLRAQLEAARMAAPVVIRETVAMPAVAPMADDRQQAALTGELAELRRMVAHQQQLLADLTVRLLDLLARFVPVAPAPASPAPPAYPAYPAYPASPGAASPAAPVPPAAEPSRQAPVAGVPADLVMDDETASRLRVIREAFGR
jgi:hypothetical protein